MVVDPRGRAVTYSYDDQGRLQEVDTPDGGVTTLEYTDSHVTIHESGNRNVVLDVTGNDLQAIHDVDAAQSQRLFSYANHQLTRDQWDPLDASFGYDPVNGRLIQIDRGLGTVYTVSAAAVQGLGTGQVGQPDVATVIDPLAHPTTYTLDVRGRALKVKQPLGAVEQYQRNDQGLVTRACLPSRNDCRFFSVNG